MIKKLLLLIVSLYAFKINADTPGKQPMSSSKVTIQNINKVTGYDFYWQAEYDSARSITGDTILVIPSSGGAPYNATFWGVNRITKKSTDTLSFENYYAPDYVVTIDTIDNNKLRYTKNEIPNDNAGGVTGNANYDNTTNRSAKIFMFAAISLIALILLIWFFIRRKNASGKA